MTTETLSLPEQLANDTAFAALARRVGVEGFTLRSLQVRYSDHSAGTVARAKKIVTENLSEIGVYPSSITNEIEAEPEMDDYDEDDEIDDEYSRALTEMEGELEEDNETEEDEEEFLHVETENDQIEVESNLPVPIVVSKVLVGDIETVMTSDEVMDILEQITKIETQANSEINSIAENARLQLGERAAELKRGDNWKSINSAVGDDYKNWGDFCKQFLNGPITQGRRQNVDRCIVEYTIAKELPKELIGSLKPSHLRAIAELPCEQRIPVIKAVIEQAPKTPFGLKISTALIDKVVQSFNSQPVVIKSFEVTQPVSHVSSNQASALQIKKTRPPHVIIAQWNGWISNALSGNQDVKDEILRAIQSDLSELSESLK